MIENPDQFVADFVTPQTEYITVHQEAVRHLNRSIQWIHSHGVKAGVSINPATPLSVLENILSDVELVLIMSVNPGFGGQKLIPDCLDKVKKLREWRKQKGYAFEIQMDGGITLENLDQVLEAGVDIVVAGSAIFHTQDIESTTRQFMKKMNG
jgi:ribulose-phosphate 3-epimerase